MMKRIRCIVSLALLVSFFVISPVLMPATAQAKNIKVGVIDCYSGPAAVFGEDALNGFKLALKDINAKGVLGKKIEFFPRDSKFKVDIALNMAKELVLR
jgi:branched-chain amino acid transport system substrate-binding protein